MIHIMLFNFLIGSMESLNAWGGREKLLLNTAGLLFLVAA